MTLKPLRLALGLSVNQLADWLQVDERTLRRWEYGERPTPHAVILACQYRQQYGA